MDGISYLLRIAWSCSANERQGVDEIRCRRKDGEEENEITVMLKNGFKQINPCTYSRSSKIQ